MSLLLHIPAIALLAATADVPSRGCPAVRGEDQPWVAEVLNWIGDRTDPASGLPASFDPTEDRSMDGQAAIYDLGITAILLAETCQVEKAARVVDRLELMWTGRGLPNFVSVGNATTGGESVVHTGPNVWVALAAHRVWLRGGELRHLRFAQAIAEWVVARRLGGGDVRSPPWVSMASAGRLVRAPAMGPLPAFSPVGAVVPWDEVVSTEHALDSYALLWLLAHETQVSGRARAVYRDALTEVAAYLEAAATSPACGQSAGVGIRAEDTSPLCIETGGKAGAGWDRRFNAADVYYWWVSAIRPGELTNVRSHAEILAVARSRFHQEVRVGDEVIAGTDYFGCTAAPGDAECIRPREEPPSERDAGVSSGSPGDRPDAGAGGVHSDRCRTSRAPTHRGHPVAEAVCSILDVGACQGAAPQVTDLLGFSSFRRARPLVSVEWTGEAILANRLIASRSPSTASPESGATPAASEGTAEAYAQELIAAMEKLGSRTETATGPGLSFPYATDTCQCVFQGGWLTPAPRRPPSAGNPRLPGALAGTVWVAFGRLGINPFRPDYVPASAPRPPAPVKTSGWNLPVRLEQPTCPLLSAPPNLSGEPPRAAFDPKNASLDSLVASIWSCREAGAAGDTVSAWVDEVRDRTLVDADLLGPLCPSDGAAPVAVPRITLESLARRQQDLRGAGAVLGCRFEDFAMNAVATARLVRALMRRSQGAGYCDDVAAIVERYPGGCFWQPRDVPGQPADRFETGVRSTATLLGSSPRLGATGFHVSVMNVVAQELPECLDPAGGTVARAAVVEAARGLRGWPWIAEAETHSYFADNLFFSDQHSGIGVTQGTIRLGWSAVWGPLTLAAYGYGRGIDAAGAAPLDRATWLRNWSAGGGVEARLGLGRPVWLRELDVRLGVRGGYIGYHTPAAGPDLKDWELVGSLSGWSLAYVPVGEQHGVWTEVSAAAYGGQTTQWSVDQRALWLDSKVQGGIRLFHVVEPYGSAFARANVAQDTDWDNNLRLAAGVRIPFLSLDQGAQRRLVVRLDGYWEHTVAYWPWVGYVPSFRPLSDYRVSLDAWLAWGGR